MSKTSTQSKMKYNRANYKRYEFNLQIDSKLNALVERYKQTPDNNFSELIKLCLCQHFGISRTDGDSIFVTNHTNKDGTTIPNSELDKFFD